jgi:hypothetical protein
VSLGFFLCKKGYNPIFSGYCPQRYSAKLNNPIFSGYCQQRHSAKLNNPIFSGYCPQRYSAKLNNPIFRAMAPNITQCNSTKQEQKVADVCCYERFGQSLRVCTSPSTRHGSIYTSDGRHAAIRGLVTRCYAFVKESGYELETHVQPFGLVQTENANSLLNLRLLPGLMLGHGLNIFRNRFSLFGPFFSVKVVKRKKPSKEGFQIQRTIIHKMTRVNPHDNVPPDLP